MDPILGQIILWPLNWVPDGWLACEGQELQIQQNAALYSLLGVTYGGNGTTTFKLPDLRTRVAVGAQVPTQVGVTGGQASVPNNLLAHTHTATVDLKTGTAQVNLTVPMPPIATSDTTFTPTKTPSTTTCLGISPMSPSSGEEYDIYAEIPSGKKPNINLANNNITVNGAASLSGTINATVSTAGTASNSINVMQPYVTLRYIIATVGTYPMRP